VLKRHILQKSSHCFAKKQNRVSFKNHRPSRKSEIRGLVHSDDNNVDMMTKALLKKSVKHVAPFSDLLGSQPSREGEDLLGWFSLCETQTHYFLEYL